MPDHQGGVYRFACVWRRDIPPGPAGSWLMQQFIDRGAEDFGMKAMADI